MGLCACTQELRANLKSDMGTDVGRHVQHRHEVQEANPQLKMVDIAKKMGEMWRGMEVDVRKEWEDKATQAKDRYLEDKKAWLEQRQAVQTASYGE